jgi:hypothetical protein
MHRRGIFAVAIITSTFMRMVQAESRFFGIPNMPIQETVHHPGAVTLEEAVVDAESITPAIVALLTGRGAEP